MGIHSRARPTIASLLVFRFICYLIESLLIKTNHRKRFENIFFEFCSKFAPNHAMCKVISVLSVEVQRFLCGCPKFS